MHSKIARGWGAGCLRWLGGYALSLVGATAVCFFGAVGVISLASGQGH